MRYVVTMIVPLVLATAVNAEPLKEGEKAPAVKLPATQIEKALPTAKDAKTLDLKDLKGKNVVLFFYPKAMTPGCTVESCGFRDKFDDFMKLNTVIIGISNDTVEDQQKFTDKEKLSFPLFADTTKEVTKSFGALNAEGSRPLRYTFVIDKEGVVRKVYTKVTPKDHPEEVLTYIKENLAK